jgi:hypothetical protein
MGKNVVLLSFKGEREKVETLNAGKVFSLTRQDDDAI